MEDYMKINQKRWDEMVAIHEKSTFYDVAGFKSGRITIPELEREELGSVEGKTLLHLQCHFGMDTMSWERLGAQVTGIDYSQEAINLARSLAQELGLNARFVYSNLYDLPDNEELLGERFDIVYTSMGVLGWLPDLEKWGKIIAHYLKPGGTFYIIEGHPFMFTLAEQEPDLKVAYPYFGREAMLFDGEYSYADSTIKLENKTEYGWNHTFSEIISALISAGLTIEFLHEFPFCGWNYFLDMQKDEDGWHRFKDASKRDKVPLLFSLKASSPFRSPV